MLEPLRAVFTATGIRHRADRSRSASDTGEERLLNRLSSANFGQKQAFSFISDDRSRL